MVWIMGHIIKNFQYFPFVFCAAMFQEKWRGQAQSDVKS
jgi:hypothetical protein